MIAFFTRNGVAANLLMVAIMLAGVYALFSKTIPLEVFPEFESRTVSISVAYRGATPEEVEESVVIRIEEAIADVEGRKCHGASCPVQPLGDQRRSFGGSQ